MTVVEIFSYPVLHRYRASAFSKAAVLNIFIGALTYILPLLLAYRSYGEIFKNDWYHPSSLYYSVHIQWLFTYYFCCKKINLIASCEDNLNFCEDNLNFCKENLNFIGFWLKTDTFEEQPTVHFKQQFLFLGDVQGNTGPIHCGTFPMIGDQYLDKKNRCPLIKVFLQ